MSDFSLTLVLQIKTSKIINDMAKVSKKSEKITPFGGIFFVLDKFDRILSSVIYSHLGLRTCTWERCVSAKVHPFLRIYKLWGRFLWVFATEIEGMRGFCRL